MKIEKVRELLGENIRPHRQPCRCVACNLDYLTLALLDEHEAGLRALCEGVAADYEDCDCELCKAHTAVEKLLGDL